MFANFIKALKWITAVLVLTTLFVWSYEFGNMKAKVEEESNNVRISWAERITPEVEKERRIQLQKQMVETMKLAQKELAKAEAERAKAEAERARVEAEKVALERKLKVEMEARLVAQQIQKESEERLKNALISSPTILSAFKAGYNHTTTYIAGLWKRSE